MAAPATLKPAYVNEFGDCRFHASGADVAAFLLEWRCWWGCQVSCIINSSVQVEYMLFFAFVTNDLRVATTIKTRPITICASIQQHLFLSNSRRRLCNVLGRTIDHLWQIRPHDSFNIAEEAMVFPIQSVVVHLITSVLLGCYYPGTNILAVLFFR